MRTLPGHACLPVLMLFALISRAADPQADATPNWIGMDAADQVQIGRTIEIREAIQSARLKLAADFCQAEVEINGRLATVVEPYSQTVELDVTPLVRLSQNQLVISASRAAGPA